VRLSVISWRAIDQKLSAQFTICPLERHAVLTQGKQSTESGMAIPGLVTFSPNLGSVQDLDYGCFLACPEWQREAMKKSSKSEAGAHGCDARNDRASWMIALAVGSAIAQL